MAYVQDWARLDDVLKRVMKNGVREDEAQRDICNAIADRKIKLRPRVEFITKGPHDAWCQHRFAGEYREFLGKIFDGALLLNLPSWIEPAAFNWAESCFETVWLFEPGMDGFPGPLRYAHVWIELATADVINVLCEGKSTYNKSSVDVALTVRQEKAAARALSSQLKQDPQMTRKNAADWCIANGHSLGKRAFDRVWPSAREKAGLPGIALPGRKPKSSR